jgi:hypothetical protein
VLGRGVILFDQEVVRLEVRFENKTAKHELEGGEHKGNIVKEEGKEGEEEEEEEEGRERDVERRVASIMMALDADEDGLITFEEFCAPFVDAMRPQLLESIDAEFRREFEKDPGSLEEELISDLASLRKRTERECRDILDEMVERLRHVVSPQQVGSKQTLKP